MWRRNLGILILLHIKKKKKKQVVQNEVLLPIFHAEAICFLLCAWLLPLNFGTSSSSSPLRSSASTPPVFIIISISAQPHHLISSSSSALLTVFSDRQSHRRCCCWWSLGPTAAVELCYLHHSRPKREAGPSASSFWTVPAATASSLPVDSHPFLLRRSRLLAAGSGQLLTLTLPSSYFKPSFKVVASNYLNFGDFLVRLSLGWIRLILSLIFGKLSDWFCV